MTDARLVQLTVGDGSLATSRSMFLLLLIPCFLFVLVLPFITPPLQVPDEMQHFYRAYQISVPTTPSMLVDQTAGAELPSSLSEMTEHFLGSKVIHGPRDLRPYPWHETANYLHVPLESDRHEFTIFSSQIIYSPLAYVPQAVAIAVGRSVGWGPLGLLYAARMANAIVALAVIASAIRCLPSGWVVIAVAAFLPMSAYEIGSVSADGQVIAFGILYTVLALKGLRSGHWKPIEIFFALLAGLIVTTAKFPYSPLLLLGLPALLTRPRTASTIAFAVGIPLVCGICCVAWLAHVAPLVVVANPDLLPDNVTQQTAYLRQHPFAVVTIALHTMVRAKALITSMIGNLGWLTVPLPFVGILAGVAALACASLSLSPSALNIIRMRAVYALLLVVISFGITAAALYLTWTPVGNPIVAGLQGRYLLPMLPLILFNVSALMRFDFTTENRRRLQLACMGMTYLNGAICIFVLIHRFQILG